MKEENLLTTISDIVPASMTEKTASVSQVYEKIKHLEPFSQEENEKIANFLNKKRYLHTDPVSVVLESEQTEYGFQIYPKIKIGEWKNFVTRVERKLKNLPNDDYIYISLSRNKDEHEDFDGTYDFDFNIITDHTKQHFNQSVIKDLITLLERNREHEKKKKQAEKALEEKKLKEQKREKDILEIITKLQNKEISAEQFKELSEKL